MGVSEIIAQIDREIAQLHSARALLAGASAPAPARAAAKTAKKKAAAPAAKKAAKKKRKLSPEGRKRIIEAVKKRWAEKRAAASK